MTAGRRRKKTKGDKQLRYIKCQWKWKAYAKKLGATDFSSLATIFPLERRFWLEDVVEMSQL